jgi:hypothetical protein
MDFFLICVGGQKSGHKFVRTCIKWKQYCVRGDFENIVGTENSITYRRLSAEYNCPLD